MGEDVQVEPGKKRVFGPGGEEKEDKKQQQKQILFRNGYPLQYFDLENSMDREAWQATVHGVTKNQTRLSDFYFTYTYMYVNS